MMPSFHDLHFVLVDGGSHGAMHEAMRADPAFRAAVLEFFATGNREGLPLDVRLPPLDWHPPYE